MDLVGRTSKVLLLQLCHLQMVKYHVGHTNNFEKRKQEHIKSCSNSKTKNHYCKIYQFIRASGGIDNWNMEILEEFYAGSRKEAEQIEQKWIDNLKPTLNMCRASK